ncbi:MAG: AAA family ATPase, partial [Chitinophagales bacterium]
HSNNTDVSPPVYFLSLEVRNVLCFEKRQRLDLSDGNKKPSYFNIILGDNGTGKTTLLKCLAGLEPIMSRLSKVEIVGDYEDFPIYSILGYKHNLARGRKYRNELLEANFFLQKKESEILNYAYTYDSIALSSENHEDLGNLKINSYSASRKIGKGNLMGLPNNGNQINIFEGDVSLINAEEWFLQTNSIYKNAEGIIQQKAKARFDKVKQILTDLLPDVFDIRIKPIEEDFKLLVEAKTHYGWVALQQLSIGYQTMMAWIVDFAFQMFERYPKSINPLEEPAIALVDEIDLHLHPNWQRRILQYLAKYFPKTQFIVTAHSPLVVQSAPNDANVILLQRIEVPDGDDYVSISKPIRAVKGWSIEEILTDLMGLENVRSDEYVQLLKDFEEALEDDQTENASEIYKKLDALLHPQSNMRQVLKIQLSSVGGLLIK